jgi:hypothetical protein
MLFLIVAFGNMLGIIFRNCGNPLGTFTTWELFGNMVGTLSKHRNPPKIIIVLNKPSNHPQK